MDTLVVIYGEYMDNLWIIYGDPSRSFKMFQYVSMPHRKPCFCVWDFFVLRGPSVWSVEKIRRMGVPKQNPRLEIPFGNLRIAIANGHRKSEFSG